MSFTRAKYLLLWRRGETQSSAVSVFVKAKIGTTIVVGTAATSSTTYKKVREIVDLDDVETGLVVLSRVGINS